MNTVYVRRFDNIRYHEIKRDPKIHHPMSGVTTKLLIDTTLNLGINGFTLLCGRIEPGGFTSPHDHRFEQAYFYLSGEAKLQIGGQEHIVGAYDTVVIPPGTVHCQEGIGGEPCVFLEICVPAHRGLFDNKECWPWSD